MTSLLFESPLPLLVIGGLAAVGLGLGFYHTSRLWMLWAAIAAAVLTAGVWLLEQAVVTERELVEQTLYAAAADLERNDLPAVLGHISPRAAEMRGRVSAILPTIEIERVSIKDNLKITLAKDQISPLAEATFNCTITLTGRDIAGTHPLFFIVRLRKEEGRWQMTSYDVDRFTAGMQKQSE